MPESLKDVFRFDKGELRPAKRTDEGYLVTDGYIARPGIYVYADGQGGLRRELVPEATLHAKAALDTLSLKPLTNEHPDPAMYPNMVTQDNVKDLSVGTVGESVEISDDGRPRFTVTVQDADAVADVESGKVELSPGYRCDVLMQAGDDPKFGKYDAIQVNRRYNHLALVDRGRGGSTVHLRMDGAAQITDEIPDPKETPMDIIEALIEKGYSKADAERLVEEGAALIQKADQFDALPSDEDRNAARVADRTERAALDAMAANYEMVPAETVKLDNDALKAAILEAAEVQIPKVDGISEDAAVKFTWATFEASYSPKTETRQDGDAAGEDDPNVDVFRFDASPSDAPFNGIRLDRYDSRSPRK